MRWPWTILRLFATRRGRAGPAPISEEDREELYRVWRAMPHRRLTSPPRVAIDRQLLDHFGDPVAVTIVQDPAKYSHMARRESETCPVCGETTAGAARLPASLYPSFAGGFSFGLGVWVHRSCFENCPDAGGPTPIPW
jgi:hypothetical protein